MLVVGGSLGLLDVLLDLLDLLLDLLELADLGLLLVPSAPERVGLLGDVGQLTLEPLEPCL